MGRNSSGNNQADRASRGERKGRGRNGGGGQGKKEVFSVRVGVVKGGGGGVRNHLWEEEKIHTGKEKKKQNGKKKEIRWGFRDGGTFGLEGGRRLRRKKNIVLAAKFEKKEKMGKGGTSLRDRPFNKKKTASTRVPEVGKPKKKEGGIQKSLPREKKKKKE